MFDSRRTKATKYGTGPLFSLIGFFVIASVQAFGQLVVPEGRFPINAVSSVEIKKVSKDDLKGWYEFVISDRSSEPTKFLQFFFNPQYRTISIQPGAVSTNLVDHYPTDSLDPSELMAVIHVKGLDTQLPWLKVGDDPDGIQDVSKLHNLGLQFLKLTSNTLPPSSIQRAEDKTRLEWNQGGWFDFYNDHLALEFNKDGQLMSMDLQIRYPIVRDADAEYSGLHSGPFKRLKTRIECATFL